MMEDPKLILHMIFLLCLRSVCGIPQAFTVGAIFDQGTDMKHDLMFVNAVKNVNRIPGFLPPGVTLVPIIQKIPKEDSLAAEQAICHMLSKDVVAVFGPACRTNSEHIKSVCDNSEVPYIQTRRSLKSPAKLNEKKAKDSSVYTSISVHPDPAVLSNIFVDLILRYRWKEVTLLFDTNENLQEMENILELTGRENMKEFNVNVKRLMKIGDEEYRPVLKEIAEAQGENIIINCEVDILWNVLNQAQQIGIVTGEQNWMIISLDAHTIDFKPFKYDYTNFTLFRMIDPENPLVRSTLKGVVEEEIKMGRSLDFVDFSGGLNLDAALIYDAVHLLGAALGQLNHIQNIKPMRLSCAEGGRQFWKYGSTIVNYMRSVSVPGLSGTLKFDSYGRRTDFELDVLNLLETPGLVKMAKWSPGVGFNITGHPSDSNGIQGEINPMMNKTLVVTTIINDPYTMLKEDTRTLVGNERYEGFVPDMVKILSNILQFNYTIRIVTDGNYGSKNATTGRWDGMIEELLTGVADIVVADLSITTARVEAVEFSMPWLNLGISIIYQKPKKAPPSLLSFLMPFSDEVWIAMVAVFFIVAFLTYLLGRFSPYEWFNPNFCVLNPKEVESQWNICNSIWHTVGALMQQGTDFCPVALSTRFLVGVFYFFTLIIVASYTANLAASLTAEMLEKPIESAEDLAKQTEIKYGVVYCGSTCNFFRTSTYPTYRTMWEFMSSPDNINEVMVKSNKEGVDKVLRDKGKYAFMMESAAINYIVERKCDLAQIGGNLDNKGYGIASRYGSGFKDLIDSAILKMQENGDFHKLRTKWWKQRRGGGQCAQNTVSTATKLGLGNLGGIFLVTLAGCLVAGLICILELLYGTYTDAQELGTAWSYELKERFGFAFRCSAFGRKGRMVSMRYKNSTRMTSEETSQSSSELYGSIKMKRRDSHHLHYPGW